MEPQIGTIEDGALIGRKIILSPRKGMKQNEYLVERGKFMNGSVIWAKACLVCEEFISDKHECQKQDQAQVDLR